MKRALIEAGTSRTAGLVQGQGTDLGVGGGEHDRVEPCLRGQVRGALGVECLRHQHDRQAGVLGRQPTARRRGVDPGPVDDDPVGGTPRSSARRAIAPG